MKTTLIVLFAGVISAVVAAPFGPNLSVQAACIRRCNLSSSWIAGCDQVCCQNNCGAGLGAVASEK